MKIIILIITSLILTGCVTRARYLDYGRDCRASGYRSGVIAGINDSQGEINHLKQVIVVSEAERVECYAENKRLTSRLSKTNYELNQLKKK